jgi:NodT family efflux transporter outer membrane factor (OMF) lipoprotein
MNSETVRSSMRHWLIMSVSVTTLAACSVPVVHQRPDMAIPAGYKESGPAGAVWKTAEPADHIPRGQWWKVFADPVLDDLAAQVEVGNQSLKNSAAKYAQARALIDAARAAYFPTVNLGGGSTRARNAVAGISQPAPTTSDSVSLTAGNWEIDLWGRIANTVDANELSAIAGFIDVESLKLSLQTQLVQSYLSLRIADEQIALLKRTVAEYQRALDLATNRYKGGVAARSDVSQAETQLKSTQAQAIDAGIARAQFEHAIAVLMGRAPSELTIAQVPLAAQVPAVPPSLPSELLERRPDIAAAERRVAVAGAQVGAARAALFPALTLSGTVGYRQNAWGGLLSVANRFWSVGPAVAFTLFDGGFKRSQVAQAEAVYDQNVATYRQTVLGAFQNVEDNLVALRLLDEEAKVQAEAVRAANESLDHALAQYRAGIVSYVNVITAQTAALNNRNAELAVQGRRFTATVGLIGALGGGFDAQAAKAVLRGRPSAAGQSMPVETPAAGSASAGGVAR